MIEIEYTCDSCGIKDAKVQVRERGQHEDILCWMQDLTVAISHDHAGRSPFCRAKNLTNVAIPLPASEGRIGDPTAH